ncbi:MAG: IS1595 family transposase [Chthoniobacter sp.]
MNPKDLNLVSISEKFSTPTKARIFLEGVLWPNGPVCPHCKGMDACRLVSKPSSKHPVRDGLLKCRECKKKFTVMVGTIFSDSHIPLNKWLIAIFLLCSSKKAISAHQLHRSLAITYKSAWFMAHRLRYAMQDTGFTGQLTGVVEIDETYVGGKVPRVGQAEEGTPRPRFLQGASCVPRGA